MQAKGACSPENTAHHVSQLQSARAGISTKYLLLIIWHLGKL